MQQLTQGMVLVQETDAEQDTQVDDKQQALAAMSITLKAKASTNKGEEMQQPHAAATAGTQHVDAEPQQVPQTLPKSALVQQLPADAKQAAEKPSSANV